MTLERLWAGWRGEYVATAGDADHAAGGAGRGGCVLCRVLASDEADSVTQVLWRGERCAAVLNAFPYTSGHLMVMPTRHVGELEELDDGEASELWPALTAAVRALKGAYRPDGINAGVNLGRAAGAGVVGHLHVHALPRWAGDANFMTSVAEARVLPEALPTTYAKLRAAWPS